MQASFNASTGHMPRHTSNFYTWIKSVLNKLQNYIKSFTLWWRTRMIGCNEVESLLFLEIKRRFKKTGSHFNGYMIYHIPFEPESCAEQDGVYFFCRMKDEQVMPLFQKSCSQKLEKEGKWGRFCVFGHFWWRRVSSHASKFSTIRSGILRWVKW